MAANFTAEEKNAEFRFNYMLHADKRSAKKWQDLSIPFPTTSKEHINKEDIGGTKQLQAQAPHLNISHLPYRPSSQNDSPTAEALEKKSTS